MGQNISIISIGNKEFNNTISEISSYFNFSLHCLDYLPVSKKLQGFDVLIIHENIVSEYLKNKFENSRFTKVLILEKTKKQDLSFDLIIKLPISLNEMNNLIMQSVTKKKFHYNSSIKFKDYILDLNERKLRKKNNYIEITEKEIDLINLLIKSKKPLSKNDILTSVWKYATDADTHTVETHIYRLRKKIKDSFGDGQFLVNNEKGYSI